MFGVYLCNQGYEKGSQVSLFKLVNIAFPWQLHYDLAGKIDCGVYMMVHMLFYTGEPFECGLADQKCRDLYRVELGASIILSDLNESRDEVLAKIANCEGKKAMECDNMEETNTSHTPPPTNTPTLSSTSPPSTVIGSRMRGLRVKDYKGDGLGCSIDCGEKNDTLLVISKFLRSNRALFASTLALRKQVIDYCFLDDHTYESE